MSLSSSLSEQLRRILQQLSDAILYVLGDLEEPEEAGVEVCPGVEVLLELHHLP